MNYLLIPDKFKDCLTSEEVITSIKKGIVKHDKSAIFEEVLISDGGDGFLNSIERIFNLNKIKLKGKDSLRRDIETYYLICKNKKTAYIELANSSGISKLKESERNPMYTSTFGTGIEIKDAIKKGVNKIVIGIGGSSTNDLGLGLISALGVTFLNKDNDEITPTGSNLNDIVKINFPKSVYREISKIEWVVINDVNNITFGENGCAKIYGAQKGANNNEVEMLEIGGVNMHKILKNHFKKDCSNIKGSGAAGGTGYGLKLFTNCKFINGIDFIFKYSGLNEKLKKTKYDYVISGEGQIDNQTFNGKAIDAITKKIKKYKIPVILICGRSLIDLSEFIDSNVEAILSIDSKSDRKNKLFDDADKFIEEDIYEYFKAL